MIKTCPCHPRHRRPIHWQQLPLLAGEVKNGVLESVMHFAYLLDLHLLWRPVVVRGRRRLVSLAMVGQCAMIASLALMQQYLILLQNPGEEVRIKDDKTNRFSTNLLGSCSCLKTDDNFIITNDFCRFELPGGL